MPGRRAAFWTLVACAVAGPVVIALPLADEFALPKLALGLLAAGILFATLPLTPSLRRWRAYPWPALFGVALLCALAISTAFADAPRQSLLGTYADYNGLLYYLPGVACFLAASALIRGPAAMERYVSALSIGAVPVVAYAWVQVAGLDPVDWDLTFGSRPFSTLGQPLVLGGYLVMLCPLVVWLALRKRRAERIFLAAEALAIALTLILTQTRGAYLGGVASAIVVLALTPTVRRRIWQQRLLCGAVALVVITVAVLVGAGAGPARLRSSQTLREREDLWLASLSMIADRPIIGWGPDQFATHYGQYRSSSERGPQSPYDTPAATPHNEMLTVLVAGGALSGAALILLWGSALAAGVMTALHANGPRREATVFALASVVAYLVQAQLSIPDVSLNVIALTTLGGIAGVSGGRRTIRRSNRVSRPIVLASRVVITSGICAAAIAFVAADAVAARTGSGASIGQSSAISRLRLAARINPLQAEYSNQLADAEEASVRSGTDPRTAYSASLGEWQRRIERFGATASEYLAAAHLAALLAASDPMASSLIQNYLDDAQRSDPDNPGLSTAIADIRRITSCGPLSASDGNAGDMCGSSGASR